MNLKQSPLTYLWSCQKDFTNIMEQEKFSFITFLSFAMVAGFGSITGKGQMLLSEPHLSPQMAELPFEKFQDEILLFSCNKVALSEL